MTARIALDELRRPILATCAMCGGPAIIWSDPMPRGTCICYGRCGPKARRGR